MSLNFPNNPALNQTFTNNGVTWQWNGTVWNLVPIDIQSPEIDFDVDHNVYFVTVDGEDNTARNGQSWQTSWRSVRYALGQIIGPATLRIGAGTFSEQLPLIVPEEVSIVGDSQRTTIVQPAAGLDINGDPNDQSTMWLLNDSTLLKGMTFTGLTGFEPGNDPEVVNDFTIGGVFIALDPNGSITDKSPYVLECSSISTGGIGAVIDGSIQANGNHSILFHAYTCVNDNGIGIWALNGGRSEVVSSFTYFCHAGYIASSGGQIRSLNGNNSYGKYGSMSTGFDASEQTVDGQLHGDVLQYDASSLVGNFSIGNVIIGQTSGAVGTIVYIDEVTNKIYYKSNNNFQFSGGEIISSGLEASVTIDTGGITGQAGFILVAIGFSEEPKPGGSVEFVVDDTLTYVIRSVTGTYVNETSVLILALTGEKITQSFDGDVIKIRYKYSQTRLTGHDFLNIGTGGRTTTNYPGIPTQPPSQGNEVIEQYPGRVYFASTDQNGNFRIGDFFRVDQSTGITTLNANAFDLSGLNSIRLGAVGAQIGELINEFSADDTLSGNSNSAVPTEAAVRGYFTKVDSNIIPASNEVYDLGSSSARWRDLYLSGNTIRLGNITLRDDSGNLSVLGTDNITPAPQNLGNINITDNTISSVNTNGNIILAPNGIGFVSVTKNLVVEGNLSVSGTVNIPADQISGNISLTTQVVGTLPPSNGGTGLSSYTANRILYSDSSNSLTTSSGLTFDGTNFATTGSINKVTITPPATDATLTIANEKTLTVNNSLTFAGTDATTITFPATNATIARTDAAQSFTGDQTIAGNIILNAQGDIRFADADSSNWVAFQAPTTVASNVTWTLPNADGTNGQVLSTNGSGTLSWTSAPAGSAAGSNTQIQFNNSGAFGASANFTFNGTGATTGFINVTSATAPTAGIYLNSTASSGLSFYNSSAGGAGASAAQIYYGRSTLDATTNNVGNPNAQFLAFGANNNPKITPGSAALYDFAGHGYLITDVPYIMKVTDGSRGDNTGYSVPENNGLIFVDVSGSGGGNAASGKNGIYVIIPRLGLGGSDVNGVKVWNRNFGDSRNFWSLLKPDDPNGGGTPVGFSAQIDTSNTAFDNSSPVGLRIDNATTDNYAKTNGGAPLAQFFDRRSGSTSRQAITFRRNTTSNEVGSITTTNSATAYNTSSDYRLKENIVPITGALDKVLQLKPCSFTWKRDGSSSEGFIAHELAEVCPQAVTGEKDAVRIQSVEVEPAVPEIQDENGNITQYAKSPVYEMKEVAEYQGVDTSFLVATLTAAIQELKAELDNVKAELSALK